MPLQSLPSIPYHPFQLTLPLLSHSIPLQIESNNEIELYFYKKVCFYNAWIEI